MNFAPSSGSRRSITTLSTSTLCTPAAFSSVALGGESVRDIWRVLWLTLLPVPVSPGAAGVSVNYIPSSGSRAGKMATQPKSKFLRLFGKE